MVIQREKQVKIWGTSDKEQLISIWINGKKEVEEYINQGSFEFFLPPQNAAYNQTLLIKGSSGDQVLLKDVDIGEVWIAGGQSNMEFPLKYDENGKEMIERANDSHIRFRSEEHTSELQSRGHL